jgi:alpha-N-arabinofuranosidase
MNYTNPVIGGFNPDPSIVRTGGDYYLCTSSFEFFPGVPIYHSRNLADWVLINYCLTRESQLKLDHCPPSGGIYAPTIRYHDGIFYMITTNVSDKGNFIVHTGDIRGEWSEPAWIDQGGIDPSLFFDEDGSAYFCGTSDFKIVLFKINPMTGEILSDKKVISRGCGGRYPEAPHIYKKDGRYYLILAEGGTEYGHMVTVQRADRIEGPYEGCPYNPVITHSRTMQHPIQCTGHADIIEDQHGRWWMVLLGTRPTGAMLHHLGRETFLTPVIWEDGWPKVNGLLELEEEGELPAAGQPQERVFHTDFNSEGLPLEFNRLRNPDTERYVLLPEEGKLRLYGERKGLTGGWHSPTFLGIRQKDFDTVTTARLNLKLDSGTIAGLTAYYMDTHHYDIRINRTDCGLYAELNKSIYDLEAVSSSKEIAGDFIDLRIRSDREKYYFSYSLDGKAFTELGTALTAGLATEATERNTFTGTYLGIFSQNGPAEFTSFHCDWRRHC